MPDPGSPHRPLHPNHRITTKPLNLAGPPGVDDLVAAGQLGGPLFPTHELNDEQRERAVHLDFGKSIEEWNKHAYPKAVALFRKHVEQFPDSAWAAEAILHVGCDATYNESYKQLIAENEGKAHDGALMLLGKARQRIACSKSSRTTFR